MTTRAERARIQGTRYESRFGIAGARTNLTRETSEVTVRTLPTAPSNPEMVRVQGWINEIGRFIDQDGLVTALSKSLLDRLDERYRNRIRLGAPTELTITGGTVTVTRSYHRVDTAGDIASDELDTISGGEDGDLLILRAEDDARTVVVKHNTGNILLVGAVNFSLDDRADKLMLIYDGAEAKWCEVGRGDLA